MLLVVVRNANAIPIVMTASFAALRKAFGVGKRGVMNAARTLIAKRDTNASM